MTLNLAKRKAEGIAAIGGIAVVALYVLGLGVTISYYSQFGVTSLSLLRAQYVLVGFYLLLPVAIFWVLVNVGLFLNSIYELTVPPPHRRRARIILSAIAFAILLCAWFLQPPLRPSVLRLGRGLGEFQMLCVVAVVCAAALKVIPRRDKSARAALYYSGRTLATTILILCLFRYIGLFSTYAFPLIPQEYGGGAPSNIRLIMSQSAKAEPTTLRLDSTLQDRSAPYQLIFDDADFYVLTEPYSLGTVLRLRKSLFLGYELLDRKGPQNSFDETGAEKHRPKEERATATSPVPPIAPSPSASGATVTPAIGSPPPG